MLYIFTIKGIGYPKLSNFPISYALLCLKWSCMCVETYVKISDKSDKNEEVIYS